MSLGGIDAVAIIAAPATRDMSSVMALQTSRVLVVILVGPVLARFLCHHAPVVDLAVPGENDPAID
ncbi:AbrB family transcriptional regulator [Rhodoblastus sp. 17X3]|uniref:AbrB family transcriptional regulator n=1 Tax=Rhodoblastus sp. 17X3 TaxID=3047026 RepID=UPI0024B6A2A1|nr:AbrB family transcriptional regulator [Rhodoblastus sp. 17X3]MDI9849725.1 AbrB family transcriptional regulator [Rhodoblastus sp. 17X3]